MSEELVDVRSKISRRADLLLQAAALARDIDRAEIVREILHSWALCEERRAMFAERLLRSEGGLGAGDKS